jgi:hypothetical protein
MGAVSVRPYPSITGSPTAWKNSATLDDSGALPETTSRSRPPTPARIFENTRRSASAAFIAVRGPTGLPRSIARARARPALIDQRNTAAFAADPACPFSRMRDCIFS